MRLLSSLNQSFKIILISSKDVNEWIKSLEDLFKYADVLEIFIINRALMRKQIFDSIERD